MPFPTKILFGVALILIATTTGAVTILVPDDYATLAEAFAAAAPGDDIVVAPGAYPASGLELATEVDLRGNGDHPTDVQIDGGLGGRVLTALGQNTVANLALVGGNAVHGGGLLVLGDAYLEDVWISGCQANLGAGVMIRGAAAELVRCVIYDNEASTVGGGLHAVDAPDVLLRDCLLWRNQAGAYGGAWSTARSTLAIDGCTVAENDAGGGAEGSVFASGSVAMNNSIAHDNPHGVPNASINALFFSDSAGRVENSCSLRWEPGWPGYLADQLADANDHNLHADPWFCNQGGWNPEWTFSLAIDSPCLPANNPDCGLIGAFDQGCEADAVPDTPTPRFALHPAYPNPFNPVTSITFEVSRAGPVSLVIYSLDGRRVASLVDEERAAGAHTATWTGVDDRGRSVASGVYIARLQAENARAAIRMTLVK